MTGGHKRPVVWMLITGVAVVAVIGLGLWALKVHSDLEATQWDLAAQTAATEAAQAQVAALKEAAQAAAAELEKVDAGNEVYVVSDEDVAQAESDVAAAQGHWMRRTAAQSRVPRRRTKRQSSVPSSNKPERSAISPERSASRRESAPEGRSA